MLDVSVRLNPVAYLYLDGPGIDGLYAQTVDRIELEYSTSIERALSGKIGATARLRNLLIKFLGGPEIKINGEISGSRKRTENSRQSQSTEQRLASLIAALKGVGEPALFSDLATAARHANSKGTTVFLSAEDEFNAPQFYSSDGPNLVSIEGYLLLEKGGADDYDDREDYDKRQLDRPLRRLLPGTPDMPGEILRQDHIDVVPPCVHTDIRF